MTASTAGAGVDLFVSYAGPDRPWAEWAAWHLEQAGYTVELDVWDWAAGDNAVLRMNDALADGRRMLALFSPAYFERDRFTVDEWTAVMADRPDVRAGRLVPVRVAEVRPPPILRPLVYRDVFGLDEQRAREALLAAVDGPRRPGTAPFFPGGGVPAAGPRVSGSLPAVWNLPPRNPGFTGREPLLVALRRRLTGDGKVWVQALRGMGGVGKTQLAIEYGHLFAGDYQLAWWVDAERAELIGEQLAALGVAAGWTAADTATGPAVAAVQERLRGLPGWLAVFDNATDAASVREWLPQGPGHVVITSRSGALAEIAALLDVEVFSRDESVAMLRARLPALTEADADRLGGALGDLPLALAQAAGLMGGTGMTADEYLGELDQRGATLLAEDPPVDYPVSLASAIGLSVGRLAGEDEAAVQLLHLCAQLAPDPIPIAWFGSNPEVLPETLAAVAAGRLTLRRTLGRLSRLGLARVTEDSLQLHRLTQAVLRDQRTPDQRRDDRRVAENLVASAEPGDGTDPASWPAWADLLPHLLALDPATAGPALRSTACNALWYLLMRGEYHAALPHALRWYGDWRGARGPDDGHTLRAAIQLAAAYRFLGDFARARELDQDTLTRRRRTLGDDHPATLTSAHGLATDLRGLGHVEQALELDEDALTRRRRTLGDDHPATLASARGLAIDLRGLGNIEQALELEQDTLTRRRRTFGDDHPATLASATGLAIDLYRLGKVEQSSDLNKDTLGRRRRVQGEKHPDTRRTAESLAVGLRELGQHEEADALEAEFGLPSTRPEP